MLSTSANLVALLLLGAPSGPPDPPPDLRPWVEYARRATDTGPACPPGQACVQLRRVEVRGHATSGRITLSTTGNNLGRIPQQVVLLGPAATFSVISTAWRQGRGVVRLDGETWVARVEPGPFSVDVVVLFTPAPSVPMQLGTNVARIVDRLDSGSIAFDESSHRHGGVMYLQSAARAAETAQQVSVRVTRAFTYGSVVTFTYRYTVSGLREQARVVLPSLGGETFEGLEPAIPYTVTPKGVEVTLTPGTSTVETLGHFGVTPTELQKPGALQFEYWLFDSDQRHPVVLETDGVEIDPGEVPDVTPEPRSRAFFLVEGQKLSVTPLDVTVDKGRQGAGTAAITYTQGRGDYWVGTLELTSTTAPASDRITIPTPAPPHYAESGGEPVRLFRDGDTLSLRVVTSNDQLEPIRVQWRERITTNGFFSSVVLQMPGQSLHLDDESVDISLLPGFVPILVLGAQHASGHIFDGLHIYAVLIALLGVALARTGRFPIWALVVTAILLAGLYTVEGFPRISLLILLTGCAVLVRLPATALDTLKRHRVVHAMLSVVWIIILVSTLIPSVIYIKDRVFSALHPWSQAGSGPSLTFGRADEPALSGYDDDGDTRQEFLKDSLGSGMARRKGKKQDFAEQVQQAGQQIAKVPRATEKTIRPVAFEWPGLPANRVTYSFGALLPGDGGKARLLLAGPVLRGMWMFAECFGLAAVLALLIIRARRWWTGAEVQP